MVKIEKLKQKIKSKDKITINLKHLNKKKKINFK
jgi:hypothetical protein